MVRHFRFSCVNPTARETAESFSGTSAVQKSFTSPPANGEKTKIHLPEAGKCKQYIGRAPTPHDGSSRPLPVIGQQLSSRYGDLAIIAACAHPQPTLRPRTSRTRPEKPMREFLKLARIATVFPNAALPGLEGFNNLLTGMDIFQTLCFFSTMKKPLETVCVLRFCCFFPSFTEILKKL
ncbi:uncharacterized protein DI49_1960 [Saccharomyces eubayanus]|uniref:uncharacterized protein n=1 Tax=Saccharomyces eubayanus TaxID=1080349 RepID=UPI0006C0C064|nr:hypothetical protein DI49_1960 [Saccharomyces eubayanus]KOG99499.1 hypothetical protein DI49_1960 [Saccharomyces eubayanus]